MWIPKPTASYSQKTANMYLKSTAIHSNWATTVILHPMMSVFIQTKRKPPTSCFSSSSSSKVAQDPIGMNSFKTYFPQLQNWGAETGDWFNGKTVLCHSQFETVLTYMWNGRPARLAQWYYVSKPTNQPTTAFTVSLFRSYYSDRQKLTFTKLPHTKQFSPSPHGLKYLKYCFFIMSMLRHNRFFGGISLYTREWP